MMFTTVLSWLGSLLGGPFAKAALDAYKAKLDAANSADAHTVELAQRELDVERREAEIAAQVVIAEQGNFFTRMVRPLWALPFIIWTWKVVVWDLCLGLGSTPELHGVAAQLVVVVSTAYFGGRTLEKLATIMKRK